MKPEKDPPVQISELAPKERVKEMLLLAAAKIHGGLGRPQSRPGRKLIPPRGPRTSK